MIKTGNENRQLVNTVTDRFFNINGNSIDEIRNIVNNCSLYITERFEIPNTKNIIVTDRSNVKQEFDKHMFKFRAILGNETQFNNFQLKANHWYTVLFSDIIEKLKKNENEILTVVVNNVNISKHELYMLDILYNLGVNVLYICNNIDKLKSFGFKPDYMKIHNSLGIELNDLHKVEKCGLCKFNGLESFEKIEELENEIYNSENKIRAIIKGYGNYLDICNFYGRLYLECKSNSRFKLIEETFEKPNASTVAVMNNITIRDNVHTITTMLKYLTVCNTELHDRLKDAITIRFNDSDLKNEQTTIVKNKLITVVCTLNNLFKDKELDYIVFYGNPSSNNRLILDILARVAHLGVLVVTPDKEMKFISNMYDTYELENSMEVFKMPIIDKRQGASTLAATAEIRANRTLFNGDTLGMYKPGTFTTCDTINFNTTYDEIKLWWNKEVYLRPGFEAMGSKANIPVMFKVIRGINKSENEFKQDIGNLCCGKTILCKGANDVNRLFTRDGIRHNILHNTDVNGTKFSDQLPFFEKNKLRVDRITSCKNYGYAHLDINRQNMIFSKIEEILNSEYLIYRCNKESYIDKILNTLLNLSSEILRNIQWFEYYTYNPNVIVILKDEETLNLEQLTTLIFLRLVGFDILIYVPTCYNSIEHIVGNGWMYDSHTIGEAIYNFCFDDIVVDNQIIRNENLDNSKKKGFFSKLFS